MLWGLPWYGWIFTGAILGIVIWITFFPAKPDKNGDHQDPPDNPRNWV